MDSRENQDRNAESGAQRLRCCSRRRDADLGSTARLSCKAVCSEDGVLWESVFIPLMSEAEL